MTIPMINGTTFEPTNPQLKVPQTIKIPSIKSESKESPVLPSTNRFTSNPKQSNKETSIIEDSLSSSHRKVLETIQTMSEEATISQRGGAQLENGESPRRHIHIKTSQSIHSQDSSEDHFLHNYVSKHNGLDDQISQEDSHDLYQRRHKN